MNINFDCIVMPITDEEKEKTIELIEQYPYDRAIQRVQYNIQKIIKWRF